MLTCTASCNNIVSTYFSNDPQNEPNIYHQPSIKQILSNDAHIISGDNCTYLLNISWTEDDQIRNMVNSIYCKVVYHNRDPCRTEAISITFTGICV